MKMRFVYFIISCMFAILTTMNVSTENMSSALKEKESSNIVLMINNKKTNNRNYTALNINKVEPQKRIVEEKEQFYSFDAISDIEVITKIEKLFPTITKKINLISNNSILLRYESRVLRL